MSTAEEIVRALASTPEPKENEHEYCLLCDRYLGYPYTSDTHEHAITCPWQMARWWVAAAETEIPHESFGAR